jgi:hypothetical protein
MTGARVSVARPAAAVNPEFLGKTGKSLPPSTARSSAPSASKINPFDFLDVSPRLFRLVHSLKPC